MNPPELDCVKETISDIVSSIDDEFLDKAKQVSERFHFPVKFVIVVISFAMMVMLFLSRF